MPIFRVEVQSVGFLVADDWEDAFRKARTYASDIVRDDVCAEPEVTCEVKRLDQLDAGWDGKCIPYGDDRSDKTLAEFLS